MHWWSQKPVRCRPSVDFFFLWDRKHTRGIFFFFCDIRKNGCFSWHASPVFFFFLFFYVCFLPWLYMKPAQSTTVGPVERVRGIKNKDINPVCLPLSLQGGQAQICQAASEAPLSLLRHALLVRRGRPEQDCLCAVCVSVCVFMWAAAPIYKYLPGLEKKIK